MDRGTVLSRRQWLIGGASMGLAACSREQDAAAPSPAAVAAGASAVAVNDPNLRAEAMLLPGLVNSSTDGPFIDLIRAIDEVYTGGTITITAVPMARAMSGVVKGVCDFALPSIRISDADYSTEPFVTSTESFGRVNFVLYSNKNKPITQAQVAAEMANGVFKLKIEAPPLQFGFPVQTFSGFENALRKVDVGRIDGLLWAQEEADAALRQLKLTHIHRENYADFADVMLLPRSPRGAFVDGILSSAIQTLRASGKLQALYAKIHLPHDPWQP